MFTKLTLLVVVPATVKHNSAITVLLGRVTPIPPGALQFSVSTPGVGLPKEAAVRPLKLKFVALTNCRMAALYCKLSCTLVKSVKFCARKSKQTCWPCAAVMLSTVSPRGVGFPPPPPSVTVPGQLLNGITCKLPLMISIGVGVLLKETVVVVLPTTLKHIWKITVPSGTVTFP